MPTSIRPAVESFFARFEHASRMLDTAALSDMFAEEFLSLDPSHATCVTREDFVRTLPLRERLFASVGATGTTLTGLSETSLDGLHTLVETTWSVQFDANHIAGGELTLSSAFLLRRYDDRWRVVAYLNHHDIVSVLAARASIVTAEL
ncbi:nuclear transport factor 2 family protein [Frankia sp. Cas4]|uniref:nuclear transport factor 2 family protein n=1 Tax=Frankia sp. Cas4 TaxID=3073927 RepID=UPI002AD49626|nr:nuclear transport factor 2 family protein [Frankia sp. Cas4]